MKIPVVTEEEWNARKVRLIIPELRMSPKARVYYYVHTHKFFEAIQSLLECFEDEETLTQIESLKQELIASRRGYERGHILYPDYMEKELWFFNQLLNLYKLC